MQAKNSEDTYPVPVWYLRETFEYNTYIEDSNKGLNSPKSGKNGKYAHSGPFLSP